MAKVVLTPEDVDGKTIVITNDNKLAAVGGTGGGANTVEFGAKEVTVGGIFVNGAGEMQLVFRQILNGNDRVAVCTGFQYGGQWYLDRPDDGEFIDLFDNQQPKQVVNDRVVVSSSSTVNSGGA